MPNTQQPEKNPQPKAPPEKNRLEMDDIPPPVIEANTSDEGEDVAQNEDVEKENEGEGNRTADRNYRRGVKKHLQNKNVEQEGEAAADALDDQDEKKDLEDAEEAARKGQIH